MNDVKKDWSLFGLIIVLAVVGFFFWGYTAGLFSFFWEPGAYLNYGSKCKTVYVTIDANLKYEHAYLTGKTRLQTSQWGFSSSAYGKITVDGSKIYEGTIYDSRDLPDCDPIKNPAGTCAWQNFGDIAEYLNSKFGLPLSKSWDADLPNKAYYYSPYTIQVCGDIPSISSWDMLEAGIPYNEISKPSCTPSWNCGDWSSCSNSQQQRQCSDGCGQSKTETQSCQEAPIITPPITEPPIITPPGVTPPAEEEGGFPWWILILVVGIILIVGLFIWLFRFVLRR